jgi:hypothetical protein
MSILSSPQNLYCGLDASPYQPAGRDEAEEVNLGATLVRRQP